jgi:hypothetical protein
MRKLCLLLGGTALIAAVALPISAITSAPASARPIAATYESTAGGNQQFASA